MDLGFDVLWTTEFVNPTAMVRARTLRTRRGVKYVRARLTVQNARYSWYELPCVVYLDNER